MLSVSLVYTEVVPPTCQALSKYRMDPSSTWIERKTVAEKISNMSEVTRLARGGTGSPTQSSGSRASLYPLHWLPPRCLSSPP